MDNATKKVMNKPSFELEYESGRSLNETHEYISNLIDRAYEQQKMTRREMSAMKNLNDEVYNEILKG